MSTFAGQAAKAATDLAKLSSDSGMVAELSELIDRTLTGRSGN